MDIDIFTFNPSIKASYKIQRKLYMQLLEKNTYLELMYAPAVEDSTKRKIIISTAHLYHSYGKSRNIIISSAMTDKLLLRNPYDIINLGLLFGLSQGQAKDAVQNNGRKLYIRSMGRRMGKTVMLVGTHNNGNIKSELNCEYDEMELDQPAQKRSKQ
ncbi:hypothetical protein FQA39_LY09190 [Lamprigera yunnana]|nr:hypothetical protein FQA39_LY09190 [Lamprigera yunnana]